MSINKIREVFEIRAVAFVPSYLKEIMGIWLAATPASLLRILPTEQR